VNKVEPGQIWKAILSNRSIPVEFTITSIETVGFYSFAHYAIGGKESSHVLAVNTLRRGLRGASIVRNADGSTSEGSEHSRRGTTRATKMMRP
jgi:hypothetical protein